jgi:hypothetical protein
MICQYENCNRTATLAHVRDGRSVDYYCLTHKWEGGPGWRVGHWLTEELVDVSPPREVRR